MTMQDIFRRFAKSASDTVGSVWSFWAALLIIVAWGITGPIFHFSDTWQLVINTGTTIITFLMVFLIQNTQNRDAKAMHLKLNELIRAVGPARNSLVDLEDLSDEELKQLQGEFQALREQMAAQAEYIAQHGRERRARGRRHEDVPHAAVPGREASQPSHQPQPS